MSQLPDLTVQLNQSLPEKVKKRYSKKLPKTLLILTQKIQIARQSQVFLDCSLAKLPVQYQSCTGLVIPRDRLDKCSIILSCSLGIIEDTGKDIVSAINHSVCLQNQPRYAFLLIKLIEGLFQLSYQPVLHSKFRNGLFQFDYLK